MHFNTRRPRRNRRSEAVRSMIQETRLHPSQLILPFFLIEGENKKVEIASMPGVYRWTIDLAVKEAAECMALGIRNFILFPAIDESKKDKYATWSYHPDCFYLKAIQAFKSALPECSVTTDVAMDPYSSDGHDGIYENGVILNDATLEVLGKMSVAQAEAGADIIGPSDMMDGRVGYIRQALDNAGFSDVAIMSYTAKYASCFYGPFRDALDSAPKHGNKLTYQMHPANRREALIEAQLDTEEGADYLMVKPALSYLDIIADLKAYSSLPIVAYNISGEYSMIKAAAEKGWIDETAAMNEVLTSIKRAGADIIITYFARQFAENYVKNK
ncbi:MAG: porphobilinogen synthase [Bacteroidota bacterium]|jgi:porphobilinogen synthase